MGINAESIFQITNAQEFESKALEVFQFQYKHNKIYQEFCKHLKVNPAKVNSSKQIPFLPIEFFKKRAIYIGEPKPSTVFTSSGTTGAITSKHYVRNINIYRDSFLQCFELFYGPISNYRILALLPSYLEREGSSLVYMADSLITKSKHPESGFYLKDLNALTKKLLALESTGQNTLLIGVSFALLDLAEKWENPLKSTIVMETGGMKGRRKEMTRQELHGILKEAFGVENIHSEYGMTELLSQAYSKGNGIFECPPWMRVIARDTEDPLSLQVPKKTGGINIIDLANLYSCAFIATQDLGKMYPDNSFEVLGRFDHADVRGCNLMAL